MGCLSTSGLFLKQEGLRVGKSFALQPFLIYQIPRDPLHPSSLAGTRVAGGLGRWENLLGRAEHTARWGKKSESPNNNPPSACFCPPNVYTSQMGMNTPRCAPWCAQNPSLSSLNPD